MEYVLKHVFQSNGIELTPDYRVRVVTNTLERPSIARVPIFVMCDTSLDLKIVWRSWIQKHYFFRVFASFYFR